MAAAPQGISAMSSADRRDLLKLCLGEDDGASDADNFFSARSDFTDAQEQASDSIDGEEVRSRHVPNIARFDICEDSDTDDEEHSDAELDDIYSFDVDRVAAMLEQGADVEEITGAIQEDLAAALEARVTNACADAHRKSIVGTELSGRMTPPSEEPPEPIHQSEEPEESSKATLTMSRLSKRASVSRRSSKARQSKATRDRRSSVLTKPKEVLEAADVSLCATIAEVVEAAKARRRLSALAKSAEANAKIPEKVQRAVDMLNTAKDKELSSSAGSAESKVFMVQQAMRAARQRHRQSIAKAVQDLSGSQSMPDRGVLAPVPEGVETAQQPQPAVSELGIQERIQQAVSMAHQRRNQCQQAAAAGVEFVPTGIAASPKQFEQQHMQQQFEQQQFGQQQFEQQHMQQQYEQQQFGQQQMPQDQAWNSGQYWPQTQEEQQWSTGTAYHEAQWSSSGCSFQQQGYQQAQPAQQACMEQQRFDAHACYNANTDVGGYAGSYGVPACSAAADSSGWSSNDAFSPSWSASGGAAHPPSGGHSPAWQQQAPASGGMSGWMGHPPAYTPAGQVGWAQVA